MTMIYVFEQIDPRGAGPTSPALTLGVEVTVPRLAELCQLGNIDPQHGGHSPREGWPDVIDGDAAITFATRIPIPRPVDVGRTTVSMAAPRLATSRPDVDSIGAMAVLVLRALGMVDPTCDAAARDDMRNCNAPLLPEAQHDAALARIRKVGQADTFGPGGAWAPRPLPTREQPWPTTAAPVSETRALAAIGVICSPAPGQHMARRYGDALEQLSLQDRVVLMALWLLGGEDLGEVHEDIAARISDACGCRDRISLTTARDELAGARAEAERARSEMIDALAKGEIHISLLGRMGSVLPLVAPRPADLRQIDGDEPVAAYVVSAHRAALGLGYCVAPFVVARNPSMRLGAGPEHEKWTIAAWSDRADRPEWARELTARLNEEERARGGSGSWGGPRNLVASPQGETSAIPPERILEIVREFAPRGGPC
jgi:hypothetical protein